MNDNEEILDLVNENDEVIGQQSRTSIYQQNLSNFRVVNLFLVNAKGQLWIPKRTATKTLFPLCLDVSMGGHVDSGESYRDALKREVSEELNMSTEDDDYRLLGHFFPHIHHLSAFMKVYEMKVDATPAYNPDDFCEAHWMMPDELLGVIENGACCKDDLPKLVKRLYGNAASL